jgi:anti-sigma-K factor RskA
MPAEAHARYRGRPGAAIAVMTFSKFPPAPAGETYQVWARYGSTWISLGMVEPDASGSARLIAENRVLAAPPEALEVTLEPRAASAVPGGRVVASWMP